MGEYIIFRKKRIYYRDSGEGKVLVLLHGFTEDQVIWDHFVKKLKNEFRIITMDLPGHGRSEIVSDVHSMDLMADCVNSLLNHLKIRKCVMIGHSMGGYVTLAFANKFPGKLRGFGLFHSHAAADTQEARINRERTINLIDLDKTGFIREFIPVLFDPSNVNKYKKEIMLLKESAAKIEKRGLIAALQGMKERVSHTDLLKYTRLPVLFIIGKNDSRVPPELSLQHAILPGQSHILLLDDVGHMGFIESKNITLSTIKAFILRANGQ